jgi:uncharacterized cupin superfamily protein
LPTEAGASYHCAQPVNEGSSVPANPEFPKLILFQGNLPAPKVYRPPAERIIAGDPVQSAQNLFQSPDGRFNSGIWSSEPGTWRVVFPESEFCHLLEGIIVVRGDDGSEATFRAGDAFLTPAGFTGTWEIVERAKKFYAFYE